MSLTGPGRLAHRLRARPAAGRRAARPAQPRCLPHLERLEDRSLPSGADALANYVPPRQSLWQPGGYLTGPSPDSPLAIAQNYLAAHAGELGLSPADVAGARVTDQYTDRDSGVTHLYLRQTFNG